MKAIVLGGGRIGAAIAADLAREPDTAVTLADVNPVRLEEACRGTSVQALVCDLASQEAVSGAVAASDVVCGALPSRLGFAALRAVIEAGKPYCDISFMSEDAAELDGLARRNGVTAVVDCGVAPGLSHFIVGDCARRLDAVEDVVIYVGGLPKHPRWPWRYKAPFAPADVIEEYTRPVRAVEEGRVVMLEALTESETLDVPGIGELEACNTDGLRSLVRTIPARRMREKTLRWPGHYELMRVLSAGGFFDSTPVECGGGPVRPIDLTARLLFRQWAYVPGETDFTYMKVIVSGQRGGRRESLAYELYDESDPATGLGSMARTTAFPCAIVARWLAEKRFDVPGVHPPERLGKDSGLLDEMIGELAGRGIRLRLSEKNSHQ